VKAQPLTQLVKVALVLTAQAGWLTGTASAQTPVEPAPPPIIEAGPVPAPTATPAPLPGTAPTTDPAAPPGAASSYVPAPINSIPTGLPGMPAGVRPPMATYEKPDRAEQLNQLQTNIKAFDESRDEAAKAVFRLGEIYRKLKRFDEARVQYARILREFSDFPDLVRISRKLLSEESYPQAVAYYREGTPNAGNVSVTTTGRGQVSVRDRKSYLVDEIRRIRGILTMVQDTSDPETLPVNVIDDSRYIRLKDDYENTLLGLGDGPGQKGDLERKRQRINAWVQQIYLPEQRNAVQYLSNQLKVLEEEEAVNGRTPRAEYRPGAMGAGNNGDPFAGMPSANSPGTALPPLALPPGTPSMAIPADPRSVTPGGGSVEVAPGAGGPPTAPVPLPRGYPVPGGGAPTTPPLPPGYPAPVPRPETR